MGDSILVHGIKFSIDDCAKCPHHGQPMCQGDTCSRCPVMNCIPTVDDEEGSFCLIEPDEYDARMAKWYRKYLDSMKLISPRQ